MIRNRGRIGLLVAALCLGFLVLPISAQATDYYVNAGTGDNGNGGLSLGDAWKTITYALSQVSGTGHTIHVAAGTYDTTNNGETFPLSMKNGVSLQGDGAATTILDAENQAGLGVISASSIGSGTTLDGFTITNGNESGYVGGGINSVTCSWTVSNCIITSNYTSGFGGGINCESTDTTTFTNCTISDNSAAGGGGVECYYRSAPTFINCIFSNNSAPSGGAIMVESSGTGYGFPKLINCTITGNTVTSRGGAFYGYSGSAYFTNCTIANNSAATGSALAGINSGNCILVNTIIWGNTGASYEIQRGSTSWPFSLADLSYSDFNPSNIEPAVSWSGSNNINSDPLFVGGGDYHLQGTPTPSPCIDAGTDDTVTYPDIPSDDRDGDSRPQGSDYDIGSDEYAAAGPTCVDNDSDGYGVCPNCGTANGCTYDGDDCDDDTSDDPGGCPGTPAGCNASTAACAICINPGATEITCDGVDQNCNGAGDEAPDVDTDTWDVCDSGDAVNPDGKSPADCNDGDGSINPGQTETGCNGVDDDCNAGTLDVDDFDVDTYDTCNPGDPGDTDGRLADCNDGDANTYPGAPETACDGVDQDCSGADDPCWIELADSDSGIVVADAVRLAPPLEDGIVDNADAGASATGTWGTSSWAPGYYATDYRWHSAGALGDTFTWTPTIGTPGTYEVSMRWTADPTRASDATYTVYYDGSSSTPVVKDQRSSGGQWVSLGTYDFQGAGVEKVELADSDSGIVVADAIKLAPPSVDITVDNADAGASATGTWGTSSWAPGYYATDYRWHSAGALGDTFTWTPTIGTPDTYEVLVRWTADPTRASDATYTVYYDGSSSTAVVKDQRSSGGQWVSLGTYDFQGAGVEKVELADSDSGIVVADAIRLAPPSVDVTVDNADAEAGFTGTWSTSSWASGYYATDYGYHTSGAVGDTFTWTTATPSSGVWEVFARWTQDPTRASDATYTIYHIGGSTPVVKDQRYNGGQWVSLGTYDFP